MRIAVRRMKVNGVQCAVVETVDWSRHELDLMLRQGEPEIELGGKFMLQTPECLCSCCHEVDPSNDLDGDGVPDHCYFDVGERLVGLASGFPVMEQFAVDEFPMPEEAAKAWSDEVSRRIVQAVRRLREADGAVSTSEVYEV